MTQPAASFRDPSGICCIVDQRVLRWLPSGSIAAFEAFLETASAHAFTARRQIVSTRRLPSAEGEALRQRLPFPRLGAEDSASAIFEHELIPFPSYPYEWAPEMLWEAASLTLELALAALPDGYGLKDATPFNVLFRGREPVFIDLLSFEARSPADPVWLPYGQFVRTFLLPLLGHRYWGFRLADIFLTRRDGLEPEEVYRLCSPLQRLKPPLLSLVSMPAWLKAKARAKGQDLFRSRELRNAEKAQFILESLLRRLHRTVHALKPSGASDSIWSAYMDTHSYNREAFAAKERFVEATLREAKPVRVLDAGANTGHFSLLAARTGAQVVAIDLDPACVGAIWSRARTEKADILPLVVDLSRPSPALGWRNRECPSFLERATGRFDCVLMLALVHHLLVTERIPLQEILHLAADLTTSWLVIEFIAPEDEMFKHLTRGREHLHTGLDQAAFEQACTVYFEIVRSLPLPGTRRQLYALKRKKPR